MRPYDFRRCNIPHFILHLKIIFEKKKFLLNIYFDSIQIACNCRFINNPYEIPCHKLVNEERGENINLIIMLYDVFLSKSIKASLLFPSIQMR